MNCLVKSRYFCPVKSLSFQSLKSCNIKKNLGMLNDRVFAFSRGIDLDKAKFIEKNPKERTFNNLLILKNSPALNKYNFIYNESTLTLTNGNEELISISTSNTYQWGNGMSSNRGFPIGMEVRKDF